MRPDERTIRFKLRMTPGSKFVYNDYTGLEIQQTAKILWTPSKRHTVWGVVCNIPNNNFFRIPAGFYTTELPEKGDPA